MAVQVMARNLARWTVRIGQGEMRAGPLDKWPLRWTYRSGPCSEPSGVRRGGTG